MKRIKFWLDTNERSASYLARKCGVSAVTMHYWLNSIHTPTGKHRKKLQKITGIKL